MNEKTISVLEKLITVCKDEAENFELAASEVKASLLQSLFRGYSLQRARFSRDLEAAAAALGRSVPPDGASGSAADEGTGLNTRQTLPRDEQTVLSVCERGEEAAVAAYTKALEESELPPGVRTLLTAQAAEVKAAYKEVRDLLGRFVTTAAA